jgi:glycosyltransferase involved in cell wall biosynthesis
MNDDPYVSVVIAVLNRVKTLEQAIKSVIYQTFPLKEVDDPYLKQSFWEHL